MQKKKVAIFGAGVGGLTVAHELIKYPDLFDIEIYESKNVIGGLARSGRDSEGCATEISWRVFFDFYQNVFKVCSEIPVDNNGRTVLNNFTPYRHQNIYDTPFRFREKLSIFRNMLYGFTSCDQRINELDNLAWYDALGRSDRSNIFREIGGWLGMDRLKGSYKSVLRIGLETHLYPKYSGFKLSYHPDCKPEYRPTLYDKSKYYDWITTKPTSEAWFDHWKNLIESKGIKFHFDSVLTDIDVRDGIAVSAVINGIQTIHADYFVFAIPVESLNKIVAKTPTLMNGDLQKIAELTEKSLHIQLSYQLYFNRNISLGKDRDNKEYNAFLVIDSPWDLIVLQYDKIYNDTRLCNAIPEAKSGWTITVCTAYIPGIIFGKPFNKCSYDEIKTEIWEQMYRSKALRKIVRDNNGFDLDRDMILHWTPTWPSFYYNKDGTLWTTEPKFTNNAGTYALRPSFETHVPNLYIATGYIKETIDIFSMEAACIAGKFVANAIYDRCDPPFIVKRPNEFAVFRELDKYCYSIGLPNICQWLIIFTVLLAILLIVLK